MSSKSLAIGLIIGLVVGLPMGYFLPQVLPNLTIPQQNTNQQSTPNSYVGYTKLTVVEGQGLTATIGNYQYAFSYDHAIHLTNGDAAYFYVATNISLYATPYNATVGATYNAFGLDIVVSEVHTSYCILMVKSNVP